jgi:hypothetical protein
LTRLIADFKEQAMSDTQWEYASFYFGNAVYPSDAIWRTNTETGERQVMVYATVGRESVDELREWWEEHRTERTIDPHYSSWKSEDKEYHALRYWLTFPDDIAAQGEWDRDAKGGGPASKTEYSEGTALY